MVFGSSELQVSRARRSHSVPWPKFWFKGPKTFGFPMFWLPKIGFLRPRVEVLLGLSRSARQMLDRALGVEPVMSSDSCALGPDVSEGLTSISPAPTTPVEAKFEDVMNTKSKSSKVRSSLRSLGKRPTELVWSEKHLHLRVFVQGPLDVFMALLVVVHLGFMVALIQLEEEDSRFSLGLSQQPGNTDGWAVFFEVSEYIFFFLYLFDVLIRIYVLRWGWCRDHYGGVMYMNLFDAFLVVLGAFDLFLPLMLGMEQESHTRSMRVVKLLRMVRTLRIVKTVSAFRQVRVLIASCIASVGALGWSMVLLLVMQLSFALVICQALQTFIQDEHANFDDRLELYGLYGSFFRALYTMYEITHLDLEMKSNCYPGMFLLILLVI